MSILNQTPTQSIDCNANESIEASNDGSALLPAISDPSNLSPQCSDSGENLPISLDLIDNCDNSSNCVFRNACFSNVGKKSRYKEEIVKGECSRGYGNRYDQVRRHDVRPNYYRGVNDYRHNHMQFPRAYWPPLISQPMRPAPFIANALTPFWSANQGPLKYQYFVPSDVYWCSAQPQAQYYSGQYLAHNYQYIYATQQSHFSISLEDIRAKLRKQIEYYFCMKNLCSDHYLRSHMDAQGWVPISLIAGFRKVEQLMKEKQSLDVSFGLCNAATQLEDSQSSSNIQFISDSLRPSLSVEMQCDKVRKRHEWEEWILPPNSYNLIVD